MTDDDIARLRVKLSAVFVSEDFSASECRLLLALLDDLHYTRLAAETEARWLDECKKERDAAIAEKVLATQTSQRLAEERDAMRALLLRASDALLTALDWLPAYVDGRNDDLMDRVEALVEEIDAALNREGE